MNDELYEKVARLQWLLHIKQMDSYRRGGHLADATRGQGRILAALQLRDGISTKDLSFLLGLAISSLNEFLSKLEKGGYITREPSEHDKRVILVKLTEKGKAQLTQPEDAADAWGIFDCLSDDEKTMLGASLDKVTDALGEKLGFNAEEMEWLKAAYADRDRMFAEMGGAGRRGFGPHDPHGPHGFRGGFGEFLHRRGGFQGFRSFHEHIHEHGHGRNKGE
jgi:DNA-binding MarR family transcriptional regulator